MCTHLIDEEEKGKMKKKNQLPYTLFLTSALSMNVNSIDLCLDIF
jgi:hypothetical protein